jgi:hypothetical protein
VMGESTKNRSDIIYDCFTSTAQQKITSKIKSPSADNVEDTEIVTTSSGRNGRHVLFFD